MSIGTNKMDKLVISLKSCREIKKKSYNGRSSIFLKEIFPVNKEIILT